ncbi:MAG: peptidylprolyl isomerase [Planctomycetes bacterium]|nr:peptidylprolyl isomerase [Planctomycetota bacterium]
MSLPRVELQIAQGDDDWGKIVVELDAEKAPETVANFVQYAADGYYDGTIFHRVIAGFMIQAGGMTSENQPKRTGLRTPVQNEAQQGLENKRGAIAMARTDDAHSATSQFFINVVDNDFLNHPGHDGWGYCAFGRVIEGMDVVDRIRNVEVAADPGTGESSQPINPPLIKSAVPFQT